MPRWLRGSHSDVGDVVVTVHCGSRGLGHQIGTEFLRDMVPAAEMANGSSYPIASSPARPSTPRSASAISAPCGQASTAPWPTARLSVTWQAATFGEFFPSIQLELLFDVSHNTCKVEEHTVDDRRRALYIHRKGATRAFGPGHADLAESLRPYGQPVLVGGSMGTESWVLVGTAESERRAFGSAVHGAGRSLSRHQAKRRWRGRQVIQDLAAQGILVRSHTARGVAEEAPGAYKDVGAVVGVAEQAGLARRVARLKPIICIKG